MRLFSNELSLRQEREKSLFEKNLSKKKEQFGWNFVAPCARIDTTGRGGGFSPKGKLLLLRFLTAFSFLFFLKEIISSPPLLHLRDDVPGRLVKSG